MTATYNMTVEPVEYTMSLSRTGGQGSKGDQGFTGISITSTTINDAGHLILTTYDAATGTTAQVDAGSVVQNIYNLSEEWSIRDTLTSTFFMYNDVAKMELTTTGDMKVTGNVESNATLTTPSSVSTPFVIGNTLIMENLLDNSLVISVDGLVAMNLDSTGNLQLAGNIDSNATITIS